MRYLRSAPSSIHGLGAFACRDIAAGEAVPLRTAGRVIDAPSGMNHSCRPNVAATGDPWSVVALRGIEVGEEATIGYGDDRPFACGCGECNLVRPCVRMRSA